MSDTAAVEVEVIEAPEAAPVIVVAPESETSDPVEAVVIEAVVEQAGDIAELRATVERQAQEIEELKASQVVTESVAEIALDTAIIAVEEVHSEPEVIEPEPEPEPEPETEPKSKGHPFFRPWSEIRGDK